MLCIGNDSGAVLLGLYAFICKVTTKKGILKFFLRKTLQKSLIFAYNRV